MNFSVIMSAAFFGALFLTICSVLVRAGHPSNRNILLTITVILAIVSLTAGCAGSPYLDIGIGKRVGGTTVYQQGEESTHDVTSFVAVGLQYKHGRCEYVHTSHPFEGRPFNDTPELSTDIVQCSVRIGGK